MEVNKVISKFGLDTNIQPVRIDSGHINNTYLIKPADQERAVLQRINSHVFKRPESVMSNLKIILDQLRESDYPFKTFRIIPAISGEDYVDDPSGFWRMVSFLEGKEAAVNPNNPDGARQVAHGYGTFLKVVNQLKPDLLEETIPNFHDPDSRFRKLIISVESATKDRLDKAQSMIDHAMAFSSITVEYSKVKQDLPLRITHGDPKASNILIDPSGKVVGVIDLDTVMPGYLMNDFGDMVRSMCNTGKEDQKDLSNVTLDLKNFFGLSTGFLESMHELLTQNELDSLLTGVRSIVYEQFIRFLKDYLDMDIYYQTLYPDHNLDRAKVHLKLMIDLQAHEEHLVDILNKCLSEI